MARWISFLSWFVVSILLLLALFHSLLPPLFPIPFAKWQILAPVQSIFQITWDQLIVPLAQFVDEHIDKVIAWPVAIVLITYLALRYGIIQSLLPAAAARLKSIRAFGISVELSEQIRELRQESDDLSRLLPLVTANVTKELQKHVKEMGIEPAFGKFVRAVSSELARLNKSFVPSKCRATVHVKSPLFHSQLMQLLEYVDGDGDLMPGRKSGRTFSIRRGIVGRVWRSQIPEIEGVLPTRSTKLSDEEKRKHIAQIWGLTLSEALHVEKYPSYISIPFEYGGQIHGVFYMDSMLENAFVDADKSKQQLIKFVERAIGEFHLNSAIGDLHKSVAVPKMNYNEEIESVGGK